MRLERIILSAELERRQSDVVGRIYKSGQIHVSGIVNDGRKWSGLDNFSRIAGISNEAGNVVDQSPNLASPRLLTRLSNPDRAGTLVDVPVAEKPHLN